jgi:hypothetical protein
MAFSRRMWELTAAGFVGYFAFAVYFDRTYEILDRPAT